MGFEQFERLLRFDLQCCPEYLLVFLLGTIDWQFVQTSLWQKKKVSNS